MTSQEEFLNALQEYARDSELAALRLKTAQTGASGLGGAGQVLHVIGHQVGSGRISGSSSRGNGNDAQVAVGVLAQIAANLLDASAALLSGSNHYAGAALLRQVVEVEYLTWAFANQQRDAVDWLNSTHDDRMKFFRPAKLRKISNGEFSQSDYQHHCELGGHPVPKGIPLLASSDPKPAQTLLLDLLLHSWRIVDNLMKWEKAQALEVAFTILKDTQTVFFNWSQSDPLYRLTLSAPPAPPP